MEKFEHYAYLSEGDCENGVGSTADIIHQSGCSCPEKNPPIFFGLLALTCRHNYYDLFF